MVCRVWRSRGVLIALVFRLGMGGVIVASSGCDYDWPPRGNHDGGQNGNQDSGPDPADCGNGMVETGEACDDGNVASGDGCSGDCRSVEICGNGYVDSLVGEECDDGNLASNDGCSSGCTTETPVWREVTPGLSPAGREGPGLTYDIYIGVTVLFGGYGNTSRDDSWDFDGMQWTEFTPDPSPPARSQGPLVYDDLRGLVVLFGGVGTSTMYLDDTWELDAYGWYQVDLFLQTPPGRYGHAMAFHSELGRVVLFGGTPSSNVRLSDTWEYDGSHWTETTPHISPPARDSHGLAYDAARELVVLFGGYSNTVPFLSDTWEYDGFEWWEVQPAASPPGRIHPAVAYHGARGRVVLFGGYGTGGRFSDTWEYDGTRWTEVSTVVRPPPRTLHALVYDVEHRQVVLFGGDDGGGGNRLGDTWAFRYESDWPDEVCSSSNDDDLDGLIACADPDCDGRECGPGLICLGGSCL